VSRQGAKLKGKKRDKNKNVFILPRFFYLVNFFYVFLQIWFNMKGSAGKMHLKTILLKYKINQSINLYSPMQLHK